MNAELQLYRHRHMCLLLTDLRLRTSGLNRAVYVWGHGEGPAVERCWYLELTKLLYFGTSIYPPNLVLFFSCHLYCWAVWSYCLFLRNVVFCWPKIFISVKMFLSYLVCLIYSHLCYLKKKKGTLFIFGYTEPVVLHAQIPCSGSCMVWILL